jgi:hypothetical protein
MRTHVTFQANFPKDVGPAEPAGRELAQFLASALSAAGFDAGIPENHENYAYTFVCRRAKHAFVVFTGLVDDGVQEWLVTVEPYTGTVTRWLGKLVVRHSTTAESPQMNELVMAIHQCLRADPRFQSVRWYTAAGWDTDPDSGWTRTP